MIHFVQEEVQILILALTHLSTCRITKILLCGGWGAPIPGWNPGAWLCNSCQLHSPSLGRIPLRLGWCAQYCLSEHSAFSAHLLDMSSWNALGYLCEDIWVQRKMLLSVLPAVLQGENYRQTPVLFQIHAWERSLCLYNPIFFFQKGLRVPDKFYLQRTWWQRCSYFMTVV